MCVCVCERERERERERTAHCDAANGRAGRGMWRGATPSSWPPDGRDSGECRAAVTGRDSERLAARAHRGEGRRREQRRPGAHRSLGGFAIAIAFPFCPLLTQIRLRFGLDADSLNEIIIIYEPRTFFTHSNRHVRPSRTRIVARIRWPCARVIRAAASPALISASQRGA